MGYNPVDNFAQYHFFNRDVRRIDNAFLWHFVIDNHRETSRDALLEFIVSTENLSVCLPL